ncbi:MAG TPA: hypothetical protein VGZ73_16895 [Bryobacteraceae bacterium]|jgi:hypothetical protein|nr:hypothetical protein [Bryobacteraceae bacterium]
MIAFAWIVMLAASTVAPVVDEVYQIPANDWRYVELGLNQKPAMVHAHYAVESGPPQVRLALMRREDVERLRAGLPHGVIEETEPAASGSFHPHPRGPGEYVVVVVNEADGPASVRLKVWLDFAVRPGPEVIQLSTQRQLVVILLSFATFFGIVTWSARRLLRGIKR